MSIIDRYLAYAAAFELSLADDDWNRIEQYFTADASYDGEPAAHGRDAVLAKLKNAVNGFDRRMDSRTLTFEAPTMNGDTVKVVWKASYTKSGLPDLVLTGSESAVFEGDRIKRMWDDLDAEALKGMGEWMAKHGAVLQA